MIRRTTCCYITSAIICYSELRYDTKRRDMMWYAMPCIVTPWSDNICYSIMNVYQRGIIRMTCHAMTCLDVL